MDSCQRSEAGVSMIGRERHEHRPPRISVRQSIRNSFEHPGTAQVQTVEMGKLAVRRVGGFDRMQVFADVVLRKLRQEMRQPARKGKRFQQAAHQIGCAQTG